MKTNDSWAIEDNAQHISAEGIYANPTDNLKNAFGLGENQPKQRPERVIVPRSNVKVSEAAMRQQTNETNQNLDLLLRNANEIDDRTKDLLLRNQSLIQRWFPSKMDKLVASMQRNTVQHAMEFRLHLYKMSTQFRLEALREKYNAALMSIRGYYREQVSEFMMNKLAELHQQVDTKQRGFLELAKSKYDLACRYQGYPVLYTLYLDSIEKEAVGFMTFLQRQIESFESIIDEQIERFG